MIAHVAGVSVEELLLLALGRRGHDRGRAATPLRRSMSGPEALNMTEIAEQISLAIGKTVRYISISREERKPLSLLTRSTRRQVNA
jgi:hypothetical protein